MIFVFSLGMVKQAEVENLTLVNLIDFLLNLILSAFNHIENEISNILLKNMKNYFASKKH